MRDNPIERWRAVFYKRIQVDKVKELESGEYTYLGRLSRCGK